VKTFFKEMPTLGEYIPFLKNSYGSFLSQSPTWSYAASGMQLVQEENFHHDKIFLSQFRQEKKSTVKNRFLRDASIS